MKSLRPAAVQDRLYNRAIAVACLLAGLLATVGAAVLQRAGLVPVRPTGNLIATAGLLLLVASLGLWLRRLHADDPGWSPAALALGSSAVLVIALAALGLIHSFSGAATEPFALVIGLLALVSAIVGLVLSK